MDLLILIMFGIIPTIVTLVLFLLFRLTKLKNLNYWVKQIIAGLLFGGVCVLSTEFGANFQGAVLNIRTSAVVAASFVFGWPAGLISAFIGSLERGLSVLWNSARWYTEWACTISTAVAGVAAGLARKLMFDDKTPSPLGGTAIALVIETFHMLMIFLTNMNDVSTAYVFVENVALKMILTNTISVFITLLSVRIACYLLKDDDALNWNQRKIASSIQRRMFFVFAVAFGLSVGFTYIIENNLSVSNASDTIEMNIADIKNEISTKSDKSISAQALSAATVTYSTQGSILNYRNPLPEDYRTNQRLTDLHNFLLTLLNKFNITEASLINSDNIVYASTNDTLYGYNMTLDPSTNEFTILNSDDGPNNYIQKFGPSPIYPHSEMKYAGSTLFDSSGDWDRIGYIQIGYSKAQYYSVINAMVNDSTTYRKVGNDGRLIISTGDQIIISDRDNYFVDNYLYESDVFNQDFSELKENTLILGTLDGIKTYYQFEKIEGYYIVGTLSEKEVNNQRDMMVYVVSFSEVIIFAIVMIVIYRVIDVIVVRKLKNINSELGEITSGNLDVSVEEKHNVEFKMLSDGINNTVDALKDYIDQASKKIDEELKFAAEIQLSSLPIPLETQRGLDLYASIYTAKQVGGDFYDFYYIDKDHLAILIADVSGKGIPAAMFMMKAKTVIKSLARPGMKPDEIITGANKELCADNKAGMFVTAWFGIINMVTGEVNFCNAGHNPPLIGTQSEHNFKYFKSDVNMVLGAFDSYQYKMGTFVLQKNETIFLYTDGVTEATNGDNELYGDDRLLSCINSIDGITNKILVNILKEDVDQFVGDAPQFDDITMLAFTFLGKGQMYKLDITSSQKDFDRAFEFIKTKLSEHMAIEKINRLLIAMDEILSNISRYGYKDSIGPVSIIISNVNDDVKITIVDEAIKYNPLEKDDPDVTLSAEERSIGGLGIFMVKKLMDRVDYYYQGHSNILIMTCKKQ